MCDRKGSVWQNCRNQYPRLLQRQCRSFFKTESEAGAENAARGRCTSCVDAMQAMNGAHNDPFRPGSFHPESIALSASALWLLCTTQKEEYLPAHSRRHISSVRLWCVLKKARQRTPVAVHYGTDRP